jgi:hypothetical protein
MKYFFAAVLSIVTSLAYADGPTTLHGINAAGELITVDQENFDYGPQGVAWGPNMFYTVLVKKDGKNIRTYEKQLCGHDSDGPFSCAKKGESPLAGARYLYVKELPNCKGSLYACKEGCGPKAPRKLIKDPWECSNE